LHTTTVDLKYAEIVWRPGSVRTRWESLQSFPDHLAGFKGGALRQGRKETRSGKGREGREEGGRKEGRKEKGVLG